MCLDRVKARGEAYLMVEETPFRRVTESCSVNTISFVSGMTESYPCFSTRYCLPRGCCTGHRRYQVGFKVIDANIKKILTRAISANRYAK